MSPIREVCLSLTELDGLIQALEEKHGVLTADFLLDADLRSRLPEDDVFQWEAFLAHKRELERNQETLRTAYLSNVTQAPSENASTKAEQNLALAA